jgi:hypothetical protein
MYFQTKNILKSNCYGNAKNYLNHQKKNVGSDIKFCFIIIIITVIINIIITTIIIIIIIINLINNNNNNNNIIIIIIEKIKTLDLI